MTRITQSKKSPFTGNVFNYMTAAGYTKQGGCPTDIMVQIEGSNRWYRVYMFCNSNSGTMFIKTKGNAFSIVNDYDLK